MTTTLTGLALFFLLKSLYDSIWTNKDVPLIDYIYPLLQTGTLVYNKLLFFTLLNIEVLCDRAEKVDFQLKLI